jgi:hypothetical protein
MFHTLSYRGEIPVCFKFILVGDMNRKPREYNCRHITAAFNFFRINLIILRFVYFTCAEQQQQRRRRQHLMIQRLLGILHNS